MNTKTIRSGEDNLMSAEVTPITDAVGSRTLDEEERECYRKLFRRLSQDEDREEREVTRIVLQTRAREDGAESLI